VTDPFPPGFTGLQRLARRTHHRPIAVELLPGDVGRRRYLRLILGGRLSVLGVTYPDEEADSRRRWNAARLTLRERLRVPLLIADDQMGNQIIEDFGRQDLAGGMLEDPGARAVWLERATDAAATLASLPDLGLNPAFDASTFRRELDLAREAVFDLWLQTPLSSGERQAHDAWAEALVREICEHPQALCHRDFHGNNLFPVGEAVGVIDFQDLRMGPDSYDLGSLLWERSSLQWIRPEDSRRQIESFASRRGLDATSLDTRFRRVLLQRAWKVCGTFARAVAQGRGDVYQRYLPGEIALVGSLLGESPEDRAFREVYVAHLACLAGALNG
jgi:aminoglycoside/choline kinase family phosphotransferase